MRFPWTAPRPTWHYRLLTGQEFDYAIAENRSRPVTMPGLDPVELETIELRLGDQCLAYATLVEPRRVGVCTGAVFDVPADAHLYHALCRRRAMGAFAGTTRRHWPGFGGDGLVRSPELSAGTGFVLGWRTANLQRRMEVWVDDGARRVDVVPGPLEPVASAWIESGV
jgi:hypothetical protein